MKMVRNDSGTVLVITLLALVLITAAVVEFTYAVHISTAALDNWRISQRLALVSEASVKIASRDLIERGKRYSYTYPGLVEIAALPTLSDFRGTVSLRIEDESAKLNINTLVFANGTVNEQARGAMVRLLKALNIAPSIADRIIDWIDPDREPRLGDSEDNAKNMRFDSIDELGLVPGITRSEYERLLPYVTIFGNGAININSAEMPVLMSLSDAMDGELAGRIVQYRERALFEKTSDIMRVAGFETLGTALMGSVTVKGAVFRVTVTAVEDGVKKYTESVLETSGERSTVRYWKEL